MLGVGSIRSGILLGKAQACQQSIRLLSSVPAERKADFAPRVISQQIFPDVRTQRLRRGPGGRSSFNGLIVSVFGCTGSLGRSVVFRLGKIGSQIICPYRGDAYFNKELKLAGDLGQVLFFPYSIRDEESVRAAIRHSNVIINTVGIDSSSPNFSLEDINIKWPQQLARMAREEGIKRLIHVSALNSQPNPPAFYIKGGSNFYKTKYEGEQVLKEEFPEATIFRPAEMYSDDDNYIVYYNHYLRRTLKRLPLHNGGYGIYKTPVSMWDVAQAIVNSITDDDAIGQTYDAVGPRRYEQRMLMEYFHDQTARTPDYSYSINNLRWDVKFRARISLFTLFSKFWWRKPVVTWERVERECITDEVAQNPTLENLGIQVAPIEDLWPSLLEMHRTDAEYNGDLGERRNYIIVPPYTIDNAE